MAETTDYIFENTLMPNDVSKYTLMRGVTDFSNLEQFDLFETGYSFLVCLQMPKFMTALADRNKDKYGKIVAGMRHILEYEFRGANGIESITGDTNSITNGIDQLNLITKVTEQSGSTFTMQYFERSGSLITKFNEAFLRGIKDPRTQIKRYNGLLKDSWVADIGSPAAGKENSQNWSGGKGFHNEIFHFLLIVTDNTAFNVERAYILASCQPTTANTEIYNVTKGDISFQELSLTYNGFPISGHIVNQKARDFLKWINLNTCFDEMDYGYSILLNNEKSDPDKGDWVAAPDRMYNYSTAERRPST